MRLCVVLLVAFANTGCLAVAIADTEKTVNSRSVVDERVSERRADIAGRSCYADKKIREVYTTHISSTYRLFSILGALVGLAFLGDGQRQNSTGEIIAGGVIAADGLSTLVYSIWDDGRVHTTQSWQETNQTAQCVR